MTDREKVIRDLEQCLDDSVAAVVPADTVRDTLALLKAQEQVEPVYELGITRCGQCNHEIDKYGGDNYCPKCGKAVKWE